MRPAQSTVWAVGPNVLVLVRLHHKSTIRKVHFDCVCVHSHLKASPWIRTWINKLIKVCFSAAREAHFFDLVAPQRKHSALQEQALRQWRTVSDFLIFEF